MGGALCADAESEPLSSAPGFSDRQDFDSFQDCLEDDGWDQGSFVSDRSNKVRPPEVNNRKKQQPQRVKLPAGINPLGCGPYNPDENLLQRRKLPASLSKPLTRKSSSLNALSDDYKKNQSSLVDTDDDVRKKIKAIIEPYMFSQVQKIVDQAVEDLFTTVNSQNESHGDSRKSFSLSHTQGIMPLNSIKADTQHKEKLENRKKDFGTFDGIDVNFPKQSSHQPVNEKFTNVCTHFSDDSDETESISRLFRADDGFQSASERSLTRVSSIKLFQVSSLEDIKQENSEIKHTVADSMIVDLRKNFAQIKTRKDYDRGQGVN